LTGLGRERQLAAIRQDQEGHLAAAMYQKHQLAAVALDPERHLAVTGLDDGERHLAVDGLDWEGWVHCLRRDTLGPRERTQSAGQVGGKYILPFSMQDSSSINTGFFYF
jgi:hypothetical protein